METYQAVVLGIIQGLTEFLPVSSSGHLVMGQRLFGLTEPALFFNISLHMGTLAAVLIVFFQEIKSVLLSVYAFILLRLTGKPKQLGPSESDDLRLALFIVIGSIPTAIIGLMLREISDQLFSSLTLVGVMLLVTAALLWSLRKGVGANRATDLSPARSLAIGFVQGLAVIPGISRSGSTIVIGLHLGLSRENAAKFSFLLSLPAIAGAEVLSLKDSFASGVQVDIATMIGTGVSFVVGYCALKILLGIVKQGRLHLFAPYCALAGVAAIISGFVIH